MLRVLCCHLVGLTACLWSPAEAGGPPGLPDGDAIVLTGVYRTGTPCSHVLLPDGRQVLLHAPLNGIAPGSRVTVRGERMSDQVGCGGPALIIRGWRLEPG